MRPDQLSVQLDPIEVDLGAAAHPWCLGLSGGWPTLPLVRRPREVGDLASGHSLTRGGGGLMDHCHLGRLRPDGLLPVDGPLLRPPGQRLPCLFGLGQSRHRRGVGRLGQHGVFAIVEDLLPLEAAPALGAHEEIESTPCLGLVVVVVPGRIVDLGRR